MGDLSFRQYFAAGRPFLTTSFHRRHDARDLLVGQLVEGNPAPTERLRSFDSRAPAIGGPFEQTLTEAILV